MGYIYFINKKVYYKY
ncbi:hypothetical protein SUNI508_13925 [Seiridium unicorne]|uniref:Uncharacterized protein n=1 Tax=Seiridium unicorne TaxID=138068 RepID=A0ABR2VB68_9PEZI